MWSAFWPSLPSGALSFTASQTSAGRDTNGEDEADPKPQKVHTFDMSKSKIRKIQRQQLRSTRSGTPSKIKVTTAFLAPSHVSRAFISLCSTSVIVGT